MEATLALVRTTERVTCGGGGGAGGCTSVVTGAWIAVGGGGGSWMSTSTGGTCTGGSSIWTSGGGGGGSSGSTSLMISALTGWVICWISCTAKPLFSARKNTRWYPISSSRNAPRRVNQLPCVCVYTPMTSPALKSVDLPQVAPQGIYLRAGMQVSCMLVNGTVTPPERNAQPRARMNFPA